MGAPSKPVTGDASGPGSRASHEAAPASSPEASIPIAAMHFETIVFRFDTPASRKAFFAKYFPGNPFGSEFLPGVRVTAMALTDVVREAGIYEGALRAIADGERDAEEIAADALDEADKVWCRFTAAQGIEAGTAETGTGSVHESAVGAADAPKGNE